MPAANLILYAQWTANPTYKVTYDGNGSTGGTAPADANNYLSGAMVTAANQGTLVKSGCTFTGWNTKPTGSGNGYTVGATFAMTAANDTLYAQWSTVITFTVTYDGNGKTGGTVPIDTGHYTAGQSAVAKTNTGVLTKTGFTFVGWNTLANGQGIGYPEGAALLMGSANDTLYARWTALRRIPSSQRLGRTGQFPRPGRLRLFREITRRSPSRPRQTIMSRMSLSMAYRRAPSRPTHLPMILQATPLRRASGSIRSQSHRAPGAHGAITPLGATTVTATASQTCAITPDAHYHITGILVGGVAQAIASPYTVLNVLASTTIDVTFGIDSLTITSSVTGANGTIAPNRGTAVGYNGSQAYTITPDVTLPHHEHSRWRRCTGDSVAIHCFKCGCQHFYSGDVRDNPSP